MACTTRAVVITKPAEPRVNPKENTALSADIARTPFSSQREAGDEKRACIRSYKAALRSLFEHFE